MKRKINNSTKVILNYDSTRQKPFELIKDYHQYGRRYTLRGAKDLLTTLSKGYQGALIISPEAQTALNSLEKITSESQ